MEKKTPLYQWHESHGGKIVPFAGYLLPVQYESGVITEHNTVREKAGLFDVSHMAEFVIKGKDALVNLNYLFSQDFTDMPIGRVRYTLMCNDEGGIVDDLVVCKMEENRYMLVVNAGNHEKDAAWVKGHLGKAGSDVSFEDISDSIAEIALQGPAAPAILAKLSKTIPTKYYTFIEKGNAGGIDCIVSKTGYTGSDGYEFFCNAKDAVALWEIILETGKDFGIIPCGLGARDTLRLEASMPLYGHEMSDTISPFEAGLGSAVKMNKDFIGRNALKGKENPARIRVGLQVTGRGIVREHSEVFAGGRKVGETTSGTFCPYCKHALAMALVEVPSAKIGTALEVDVRGRKIEAVVVPMPFYKKGK
ncbi:MAG: glycine cleavage system aminomethyltransferase GcvT [Spirochaetaceae bacterium]|nr:glycine cleavage system aminomethyltransferase GcvT [Spirochaetaceae bacterium]